LQFEKTFKELFPGLNYLKRAVFYDPKVRDQQRITFKITAKDPEPIENLPPSNILPAPVIETAPVIEAAPIIEIAPLIIPPPRKASS
jgi:hypothetical protein